MTMLLMILAGEFKSLYDCSCVYYRAGAWKFKLIWCLCVIVVFTMSCLLNSTILTFISCGYITYNVAITLLIIPAALFTKKYNYITYYRIVTAKFVIKTLKLCNGTSTQIREEYSTGSLRAQNIQCNIHSNNDNIILANSVNLANAQFNDYNAYNYYQSAMPGILKEDSDTRTLSEFILDTRIEIRDILYEKNYVKLLEKCKKLDGHIHAIELHMIMYVGAEKDSVIQLLFDIISLMISRSYHFANHTNFSRFIQLADYNSYNRQRLTTMILGIKKRYKRNLVVKMIINTSILTYIISQCSGKIHISHIVKLYQFCNDKDIVGLFKRFQLIEKNKGYKSNNKYDIQTAIQWCATKLGKYEIILDNLILSTNTSRMQTNHAIQLVDIYTKYPDTKDRITTFCAEYAIKQNNWKKINASNPHFLLKINETKFNENQDPLNMPIELLCLLVNSCELPLSWMLTITQKFPDIIYNQVLHFASAKTNKELYDIFPNHPVIKCYNLAWPSSTNSYDDYSDAEWIKIIKILKETMCNIIIPYHNKWIISKLIDLGRATRFPTASLYIEFDWAAAGTDSWNKLRATVGWKSQSKVNIKSGIGYDAGGITRALYWDIGKKVCESSFIKHEGYLLPDINNMNIDEAKDFGALIARCIVGTATPIGIDIHPAIYYFCGAHYYLQGCSWEVIEFSLGREILRLLAPESLYNRTPETVTQEIQLKYVDTLPLIMAISKLFIVLTKTNTEWCCYSPEYMAKKICGERILIDGVDGLITKLNVTGDGAAEYKIAMASILHDWNSDDLDNLFMFWFGCPRPDFHGTIPCMHVTSTVGLAQSSTCSYQLRVPYYPDLHGDNLKDKLGQCLKDTMAEQAAAEASEDALHFSMA